MLNTSGTFSEGVQKRKSPDLDVLLVSRRAKFKKNTISFTYPKVTDEHLCNYYTKMFVIVLNTCVSVGALLIIEQLSDPTLSYPTLSYPILQRLASLVWGALECPPRKVVGQNKKQTISFTYPKVPLFQLSDHISY